MISNGPPHYSNIGVFERYLIMLCIPDCMLRSI